MAPKQSSRMQVAVRLRPTLKQEDRGKEPCVRGLSGKTLQIWNWRDTEQSLQFEFDAYFDDSATQRDIHKSCVVPLLSHILSGQNASVFAYGPTGTGKTYTMLGTDSNPGIIPRSLSHIFKTIETERKQNGTSPGSWSYTVSFSYLEIYQERVYDLLEPKDHDLPIREDRDRNIFIPNLAEKTVATFSEFAKYFIPASKNRTTAATKLNSRSSRSHSILLLKVVKERTEGGQHCKQTGKLYLIDLAGSENNKKTGNQGIRLKESGAINTSLFVLGQVVDALNQRLPRIPYRDSKLTRLLQDSLGGSAHACMVTNVAPEERHYMDTYTTLHFASKSKQIINKPFTRETTETIRVPHKRGLEDEGNDGKPAAKVRALDDNGRPTSVADSNSNILQPLLQRQANFEATVQQRLQSLEKNLLRHLKESKTKTVAPTSRKLLSEMKGVRKELSNLNKQSTTTLKPVNRPGTGTQRPSPPQAVVRPMTATAGRQHTPTEPRKEMHQKAELHDLSKTKTNFKPSVKPVGVKFMKAVPISKENCTSKSSHTAKENKEENWHLQLDPDFQAKHTTEILNLLNTGSVKQLKSLQSVGEKRAQLIHNWRQAFGSFEQIDDLYKVSGLPSRTIDNIIRNNLLTSHSGAR